MSLEEKCEPSVIIEQLRREMEEMRSSSKAELLKAWDEIERLEDEKVDLKNHNLTLANLLQASMEREKALNCQVEELQEQVRQHAENERPNRRLQLSNTRHAHGSISARSVCSVESYDTTSSTEGISEMSSPIVMPCGHHESAPRWNWYASRKGSNIQEEKERLENEFLVRKHDMEVEYQEIIEEWKAKVASGDVMLQCMEQARQIHIDTLEQLMDQLKEHDSRASKREVDLKQKIRMLKRELYSKAKYVIKQNEKMDEYKSYIEDLTSELERIPIAAPYH